MPAVPDQDLFNGRYIEMKTFRVALDRYQAFNRRAVRAVQDCTGAFADLMASIEAMSLGGEQAVEVRAAAALARESCADFQQSGSYAAFIGGLADRARATARGLTRSSRRLHDVGKKRKAAEDQLRSAQRKQQARGAGEQQQQRCGAKVDAARAVLKDRETSYRDAFEALKKSREALVPGILTTTLNSAHLMAVEVERALRRTTAGVVHILNEFVLVQNDPVSGYFSAGPDGHGDTPAYGALSLAFDTPPQNSPNRSASGAGVSSGRLSASPQRGFPHEPETRITMVGGTHLLSPDVSAVPAQWLDNDPLRSSLLLPSAHHHHHQHQQQSFAALQAPLLYDYTPVATLATPIRVSSPNTVRVAGIPIPADQYDAAHAEAPVTRYIAQDTRIDLPHRGSSLADATPAA